jgi:hypothetical protein
LTSITALAKHQVGASKHALNDILARTFTTSIMSTHASALHWHVLPHLTPHITHTGSIKLMNQQGCACLAHLSNNGGTLQQKNNITESVMQTMLTATVCTTTMQALLLHEIDAFIACPTRISRLVSTAGVCIIVDTDCGSSDAHNTIPTLHSRHHHHLLLLLLLLPLCLLLLQLMSGLN